MNKTAIINGKEYSFIKTVTDITTDRTAVLCEDEHGNVSYISSEHRKKWLNTMYAKEQRIRNGKKGRSDKDD